MIPQKIESYLEYIAHQDALWYCYDRARRALPKDSDGIQDHAILAAMSGIYDKLMRHLESAYYEKLCGRGLLSEEEIAALKQKLIH